MSETSLHQAMLIQQYLRKDPMLLTSDENDSIFSNLQQVTESIEGDSAVQTLL
jgi:hypothetical protein